MNQMKMIAAIGVFLSGGISQAADLIICTKAKYVPVMEDNMKIFAFSGVRFETVSLFQGWGVNEKTVSENGVKVKYLRAQFPDRTDENNDVGWIRSGDIKEKTECADFKVEDTSDSVTLVGSGLEDENCCRFPFASSAQADYTTGMRQFGWRRAMKGGGIRKHAASDLYHREYEPVYAIADGELLRDRTGLFAGETTVTEVRHVGGFIVRYGEIATPTQKRGLVVPKKVKAGTLIGYIKKVSGAPSAMLHFELYKGNGVGSYTVLPCRESGSFCRRSDLLNPAPYLQKWESSRNEGIKL